MEEITQFLEAKYVAKEELLDLTLYLRRSQRLTSHVLALLVRRFGRMQLWQTAFGLLFRTPRALESAEMADPGLYVAAADASRSSGRWDSALCVLARARQDGLQMIQNVSNAVSSAVFRCRAQAWPRVLQLLLDMLASSRDSRVLVADQISFGAAISACGRAVQWHKGMKVVGLMRRWKLFPETVPLTSAAAACNRAEARTGAWRWSLCLCDWVRQEGSLPSLTLYNCAIAAASRGAEERGNWTLAVQQLDRLHGARLQSDRVSLSSVFAACQRAAAAEPALEMLSQFSRTRIRACAICHSSVIMACAAKLKWQEGAALLLFLKKSFDTRQSFLRSIVRAAYWRESLRLLRFSSAPGGSSKLISRADLVPALEACSAGGKVRRAYKILQAARSRGWQVTVQEQALCIQSWSQALVMHESISRRDQRLALGSLCRWSLWRVAFSLAFQEVGPLAEACAARAVDLALVGLVVE